jgi:hypothetical protein
MEKVIHQKIFLTKLLLKNKICLCFERSKTFEKHCGGFQQTPMAATGGQRRIPTNFGD